MNMVIVYIMLLLSCSYMILPVNDNESIAEIQDRFNEAFPGLKLEFFYEPHGWGEPSFSLRSIDGNQKIGEVRKHHEQGLLDIKSWYKAGEVEKLFKKAYGLFVQIYYLDNGVWVETRKSDDLSLAGLSRRASDSLC